MLEIVTSVRRQGHDRYDPEPEARDRHHDELASVRELEHGRVPVAPTEPCEPSGHSIGGLEELAIRHALVMLDERHPIGPSICPFPEMLPERSSAPVALGDV